MYTRHDAVSAMKHPRKRRCCMLQRSGRGGRVLQPCNSGAVMLAHEITQAIDIFMKNNLA
jgi:hypothetical protein